MTKIYKFTSAFLVLCSIALQTMAQSVVSNHLKFTVISGKNEVSVACAYESREDRKQLTQAHIPSSVEINGTNYAVTTIADEGFYRCSSLISLTLPRSLTTLGVRALGLTGAIEELFVPNTITSWGIETFKWSSIKKVVLENGITALPEGVFTQCYSLSEVILPYTLKEIPARAFADTEQLTQISIPSSVTKIKKRAFSGVGRLASIEIPASVTSIEESAFLSCGSLQKAVINANITKIESRTFMGCVNLAEVVLPLTLKEIGQSAFYQCFKLDNINFSERLESIGSEAFAQTGFTKLYIPDGIKVIEPQTFRDCKNLKLFSTGNNVTTIKEYAFENCGELTELFLGEKLQTIERSAFKDCGKVKTAHCLAPNPPTSFIDSDNSKNDGFGSIKNCTLYVKPESVELYRNNSTYTNRFIIAESTLTGIKAVEQGVSFVSLPHVYTLSGKKVLTAPTKEQLNILPKGVYIIGGKKVMIK